MASSQQIAEYLARVKYAEGQAAASTDSETRERWLSVARGYLQLAQCCFDSSIDYRAPEELATLQVSKSDPKK